MKICSQFEITDIHVLLALAGLISLAILSLV